jgi:hypothetical protein
MIRVHSGITVDLSFEHEPGQNVEQQLTALRKILTILCLNLHAQNDVDRLHQIAPAFGLFREEQFDSWILDKFPSVVRDYLR